MKEEKERNEDEDIIEASRNARTSALSDPGHLEYGSRHEDSRLRNGRTIG